MKIDDAAPNNAPDVIDPGFKTGITDMYQFVSHMRFKKFRVPEGQTITIRGLRGGLVDVSVQDK